MQIKSLAMKTPRKCVECGKEYLPNNSLQKYCSVECAHIVHLRQKTIYKAQPRREGRHKQTAARCAMQREAENRRKAIQEAIRRREEAYRAHMGANYKGAHARPQEHFTATITDEAFNEIRRRYLP